MANDARKDSCDPADGKCRHEPIVGCVPRSPIADLGLVGIELIAVAGDTTGSGDDHQGTALCLDPVVSVEGPDDWFAFQLSRASTMRISVDSESSFDLFLYETDEDQSLEDFVNCSPGPIAGLGIELGAIDYVLILEGPPDGAPTH